MMWTTVRNLREMIAFRFPCAAAAIVQLATFALMSASAAAQNVIVAGSTGANGSYATLGAAFNALNANSTQTGNAIIVAVVGNTDEGRVTATLNEPSGGSWTTLTVRPSGGARIITGSNTGALIRLNGTERVTIDGSTTGATATGVGGNGLNRELTFQNTNASFTAAVISVSSTASKGAQSNTLRNLNVSGIDPTTSSIGIALGGFLPGSLGADNDNNNIENCSVKRFRVGIYSGGVSAANPSVGTVITMSETSAVFADQISQIGIFVVNENGAQITQNSINGLSDSLYPTLGNALGIRTISHNTVSSGGVTNALVAGNKINGVVSPSDAGVSAVGVAVAGATGGANTILNNMITGVTSRATSPDLVAGIFVAGVPGSVTRVHHNSVAMTGERGGAVFTQFPSYALAITGMDPTVEVKNNIFYATQTSSRGGTGANSYVIGTASATIVNLDSNYNDFFSSGANAKFIRSGSLAGNTGTDHTSLAQWRTASAKDARETRNNSIFPPYRRRPVSTPSAKSTTCAGRRPRPSPGWRLNLRFPSSFAVDPGYVDPASDLHLSVATTPLVGSGITGFASFDFDNDSRSLANPEMGADQLTLPDMAVSKTHSGNFALGQVGATDTVIVSNTGVGAKPAGALVTLREVAPAGLTLAAMTGAGWSCTLLSPPACSRSDALAAGQSFPPVTGDRDRATERHVASNEHSEGVHRGGAARQRQQQQHRE